MGLSLLVDPTNTAVPLDLTLTQEGVGGLTGQTPTVALRLSTTGAYLDFATNQFKTSSWTTKYKTLTEVEKGHYQTLVNLATITPAVSNGQVLVAEYELNAVAGKGVDHDLLLIAGVFSDTTMLRKALTNRMEESPGNPGVLILFDDDGATPLMTWYLRDAQGGAVIGTVGAPARRSAKT